MKPFAQYWVPQHHHPHSRARLFRRRASVAALGLLLSFTAAAYCVSFPRKGLDHASPGDLRAMTQSDSWKDRRNAEQQIRERIHDDIERWAAVANGDHPEHAAYAEKCLRKLAAQVATVRVKGKSLLAAPGGK